VKYVFKTFPKTHITIAAAATVVVTTAMLMGPSAEVEAKRMSITLDLESAATTAVVAPPALLASLAPKTKATQASGLQPTHIQT